MLNEEKIETNNENVIENILNLKINKNNKFKLF